MDSPSGTPKRIKIKFTLIFCFLTTLLVVLSVVLYNYAIDSAMLDPKGLVALKERDLMYIASMLMLIIVIPVFILMFAICVRYRASNKSADYHPNWNHDTLAESIWWGFPCLIIIVLSIIGWKSSHELDPFKPLLHTGLKPLKIQAVALQWKWLFIYPDQEIASLNFLQFPEQTVLDFEITSDAPMNSFWIPQLGGQIYAMAGMSSRLHLIAHEIGDFRGSSANLSGEGFAAMTFTAKSTSPADFEEWVKQAKQSKHIFGWEEYQQLARPSEHHPVIYALKSQDLYDRIVNQYLVPSQDEERVKNR